MEQSRRSGQQAKGAPVQSTVAAPSAAQLAQAKPAPPAVQPNTSVAPPPRAVAPPPRVERPTGQTEPIEQLTIVPQPSQGNSPEIEFDWEPALLGTNRSYSCSVTTDPAHALSVSLEQGLYRRSFDGQGTVNVTVIPPASPHTRGTLTARNRATGASATFTWQWQARSAAIASAVPPKPAGLFGRLFGRTRATAVVAKAQTTRKPATVAERLGTRASLAVSMTFFGQEAVGQRFAFILDRSGSMRGQRWSSCTEQLARALRSMPEHAEYFVILFASNDIEPAGQTGWMQARREHVDEVIRWVDTIWPGGGTYPTSAFRRVFSLPAAPDVIYFLTDGEVGDFTPERCAELRGSATTIVNTIALENAASADVLRETAEVSGGQFLLIPDASSTHTHG